MRLALCSLALFLLTTRSVTVADALLHVDTAVGLAVRGSARLSIDPGDMVVTARPLAGGLFFFDTDGGVRSAQPPGLAVLALPVVAAGERLASRPLAEAAQPAFLPTPEPMTLRQLLSPIRRDPRVIAFSLISPVAGALTMAWLWLALGAARVRGIGRALASAALLLSPLGVYAGTGWTQSVTAAAFAFATWRCLDRGRAVSIGTALALAVLVRPDHLLLGLPFALVTARRGRGHAIGVTLPLVLAIATLAAWGLPEDGGGWAPEHLITGTLGSLVSPNSGLLFFAPFVFVGMFGLGSASNRWLFAPLALALPLYGGWFDWDATFAFGPRFLVPVLPSAAVAFGAVATRRPRLATTAVALGALVNVPGMLLAHPRIPESHAFFHPAPVEAWRVLIFEGVEALGPGIDCAALSVAPYAWLALVCAVLGATLGARRPHATESD